MTLPLSLTNRTMESLSFIATICLWQPQEVQTAQVVVPSEFEDAASIPASQVSFSLQDIGPIYQDPNSIFADRHYEDDMSSWINTRPDFLNGTMVVPLLIFAFLVVSAILLTLMFSDDDHHPYQFHYQYLHNNKEAPLLPEHDMQRHQQQSRSLLPTTCLRIPLSRRRISVLETIQEHEP